MGKKYALDLSNPEILRFIELTGINTSELEIKKIQDFYEFGILPEVQEARYNYHKENIYKILFEFRAYLKNRASSKEFIKKKTENIGTEFSGSNKSPKIFKSATLRKPSTEAVSSSQIKYLEQSENRGKKIQDLLKTKILQIKRNFELKKNKQLEKLVQLEGDREKKNKILFEKLNRINSFQEKVSKSVENVLKKPKFSKISEAESDENIKKYFEKLDRKFSQSKKRSEQDIHTKVLKAKRLSRNRSICKKDIEENELRLQKLIKKVEKINEIKKDVEKNKKFRIHLSKLKDENKKKEVMDRIVHNELEVRKKIKETEKKLNKNLDWVLEEKLEKMKNKAVQNEIEQLSAKTRIDRLHTKFNLYQSRLFSEHQCKAKRVQEFIEQRSVSSTKKLKYSLNEGNIE